MLALDWLLWLMELWQAISNVPSRARTASLNNFIGPLIVRYQNLWCHTTINTIFYELEQKNRLQTHLLDSSRHPAGMALIDQGDHWRLNPRLTTERSRLETDANDRRLVPISDSEAVLLSGHRHTLLQNRPENKTSERSPDATELDNILRVLVRQHANLPYRAVTRHSEREINETLCQ